MNFATQVMPTGSAAIGNSEPARNHGAIAIAGTRAVYSSALGTRLASVSAAPAIATVSSTVADTNHATPLALAGKPIPRSAAAPINTAIWRAVVASVTVALASTSSGRRTGAARSSR